MPVVAEYHEFPLVLTLNCNTQIRVEDGLPGSRYLLDSSKSYALLDSSSWAADF
jgi:hypothetical protein